jgi:hypothetical protein
MYCAEPEGAMGFLDIFRRRRPARDLDGLADSIDAQAAFLAQKGIFEYSRARGGPHGNTLLHENAFLGAVETSRWRACPLALAMIGEMLEGALRPQAGAAQASVRDGVLSQVRLQATTLHAPKLVKDIAEPYAEPYFELMPIHERLTGRDFPALRNYLQVTLVNIHREFTERADLAALIAALAPVGATAPVETG